MYAASYQNTMRNAKFKFREQPKIELTPAPEPEPQPQEARSIPGVPPRISAVLLQVADRNGIPAEVMLGKGRTPVVAQARHEAFYALKEAFPWCSWPQIGKWVGGREHTTAMHGAARHAELTGKKPLCRMDIIAKRARYTRAANKARRAA
jgi:hypothetical protein